MPRDNAPGNPFRLNPDTLDLVESVRRDKYMLRTEHHWDETHNRVAAALFADDADRRNALSGLLNAGIACPAGRVLAGAGSDKHVTWWNCFVAPLLQDSMRTDPSQPGQGIMDCLASVAYSMQMGGGVGTDFSPIRPKGALVRRVDAPASGPLSFMDMWDSMCRTIMSAGARRGAMMATLSDDHPDILDFITAKHDPNRLRMFNVSILVSDAFMQAKERDEEWCLGHWEPPFDISRTVEVQNRRRRDSSILMPWYVYRKIRARKMWNLIMESTYRYAEPGTIFIDRINRTNNLHYCENIRATNPCGEQPLPPDANCNLSHVNLSRCTSGEPFEYYCAWDLKIIECATRLLVRMSDNVIDLSPVPTPVQLEEAQKKRRIGLGITGLANALMFQHIRYGSPEAVESTTKAMCAIRDAAYCESVQLAREKGPFPLFDREKYLQGEFIETLPEDIRAGIAEHGIRNALLLTVAPTGTVSIAQADNSSAGLEPVFAARYKRRVLQPDNTFRETTIEDFGFRVYANVKFGGNLDAALAAPLPTYMVTTKDLTAEDHLQMQAAVQTHIDASVSKTINLPTETAFTDFARVYDRAYELGCKGCTTYREVPDSGRGAVLTPVDDREESPKSGPILRRGKRELMPWRRDLGHTQKVKLGNDGMSVLLTINEFPDGRPGEMYVELGREGSTTRAMANLWAIAVSIGLQYGVPVGEYVKRFVGRRFEPTGLVEGHDRIRIALSIADYVGQHLSLVYGDATEVRLETATPTGRECPACGNFTLIRAEDCDKCLTCTYNKCG
jgi:ribonucleoside-diphosphate reductase alpha chain